MKKVYLLHGDDNELILERVSDISKQLNELQKYNPKKEKLYLNNLEDIELFYTHGSNMSLFSENSILEVYISAKSFKHIDKEYTDFYDLVRRISVYKTVILIFYFEKYDKVVKKQFVESVVFQRLRTDAYEEECVKLKYWQTKEIKEKIKHLSLKNRIQFEENALSLFVDYFKEYIDFIPSEINKLQVYLLPENTVTVGVLEDLYLNNINIDELYRNLLYSKKTNSIFRFLEQLVKSKSHLYIIASLQSKFRQALQIKTYLESNLNVYQISKLTGINSYRLEKEKSELKDISAQQVIKILNCLSNIEFKVKTGLVSSENALDLFLVSTMI